MRVTKDVPAEQAKPVAFTGTLYMTIIPDRWPRRKIHTSIGQAKNAIGYTLRYNQARGGELWEIAEPENILLYSVPPGTHADDLPWRKND